MSRRRLPDFPSRETPPQPTCEVDVRVDEYIEEVLLPDHVRSRHLRPRDELLTCPGGTARQGEATLLVGPVTASSLSG